MGVINHQPAVRVLTECRDFRQPGYVAIHAENTIAQN
jgi:hypothetical protein